MSDLRLVAYLLILGGFIAAAAYVGTWLARQTSHRKD